MDYVTSAQFLKKGLFIHLFVFYKYINFDLLRITAVVVHVDIRLSGCELDNISTDVICSVSPPRHREACPVHRGGATHEGGEHPAAEKASKRNGAQGGPVQTTVRK